MAVALGATHIANEIKSRKSARFGFVWNLFHLVNIGFIAVSI